MSVKALRKSIIKWNKIVNGTGGDDGIDNCALCKEYYSGQTIRNRCEGCPVLKATGKVECIKTPYQDWTDHLQIVHGIAVLPAKRVPYCRTCMKIAREELAFLKSLRTIYIAAAIKRRENKNG